MPASMRKQSRVKDKRNQRDARLAQERRLVLHLLQNAPFSIQRIASISSVSYGTCCRIDRSNRSGDMDTTNRLLEPETNCAGPRPHLTNEQEAMISASACLFFASRRGFAADVDDLKSLTGQAAQLNGCTFRQGLPSSHTFRAFRSKHHEITLRN